MDWPEISLKFAECAALAQYRPTDKRIARAVGMAKSLEQLTSATELIALLS